MIMVDVNHFDYEKMRKIKNQVRRRGNPGTRKVRYYRDIICAFDIETTNLPDEGLSFMYVWQFQVGNICTVIGRTWDEFLRFLEKLSEGMRDKNYYVVYIHNASFEFSFIKGIYGFTEEEVFCLESRKVLKFDMFNHFEFRCSYIQSNMSLDEFAKRYAKTRKYSGKKFNYDKIRYSWTRLNRTERKYIQNDVICLVEAMENRMKSQGDNLYSVPLTSTGYVRRLCKKSMSTYPRQKLKAMQPDYHTMMMLLEAYRGGNTHSNRYMTGQIWDNVHSVDIASSYPASQLTELYPMEGFYRFQDARNLNIDKILNKLDHGKALLIRFAVWKVKLIEPLTAVPYLARHKCRQVINPVLDNGRICYADYLETTMTDIDFRIFIKQYDFTGIQILDMMDSVYEPLPEQITSVTRDLYFNKTKGKGGNLLEYNHLKALLNSIYGMSVTNPIKPDTKLINGNFIRQDDDLKEKLEKANKNAFQCYQWGVWICAWSRWKLQRGIDEVVGQYDFIYCDTDSIKYIGEHDFTALNQELELKAEKVGAIAPDPDGVLHPIGIFEREPDYEKFRTWGAKKYAFVQNGKLGLTVAGVNKKKGAMELEKRGGLEAFKEGMVFMDGGGTEAMYEDNYHELREVDGKYQLIVDGCCIRESSYTMGLTGDYLRILEHPALWLDFESF